MLKSSEDFFVLQIIELLFGKLQQAAYAAIELCFECLLFLRFNLTEHNLQVHWRPQKFRYIHNCDLEVF